jgi:hypothetical protein
MLATGSCENLYSEPVSDFNNALPLGKAHTMQEPSAELHKAQESLRAYEAICKDLQQRLSDMENDLRDAHDVIFRLQPSHHHITRNEAQFQYDALCEGVGSWINFHFEDTFNDNSAARGNFNRKSAEILVGWMTPSSRSSRKVLDTDEYHIISAVMNFLLQEILGKDFYGAAQDGALEFLQALERSMSCLEPRRGKPIY